MSFAERVVAAGVSLGKSPGAGMDRLHRVRIAIGHDEEGRELGRGA